MKKIKVFLLLCLSVFDVTAATEPDSNATPPTTTTATAAPTASLVHTTSAPLTPPAPTTRDTGSGGGGGAVTAMAEGLRYLERSRDPDWSWGNDTHAVLLAIQFANSSWTAPESPSLELQLSAKQMDIEILLMMSKHHEAGPPLGRLAAYILALGALCRDPRNFYGRDLVAALLHREPPHDLDFAHATLAACSSAAHVRRRHIRRLLDVANAAADHNLDTISMVILALRCIVQDHRHRDLLHFVRRPMAGLARQQQPDGGFGGVATTALALQALDQADQHWNRSAARSWLVARQDTDGGWGSVADTAAALAALAPPQLAAVRPPHCRAASADALGVEPGAPTVAPGGRPNDTEGHDVHFTYTLWVGSEVTDNMTLRLSAPRNVSFYHVMQQAAERDPRFRFQASEWPNGHYVHTLWERREEPMRYQYWLLYRLPEAPDPQAPPGNQLVAPVGVDDLLVEEGEHYLFWYKKL